MTKKEADQGICSEDSTGGRPTRYTEYKAGPGAFSTFYSPKKVAKGWSPRDKGFSY